MRVRSSCSGVERVGLICRAIIGTIIQQSVRFAVRGNDDESVEAFDRRDNTRIAIDIVVVPGQIVDDAGAASAVPAFLIELRPCSIGELRAQQELNIRLDGFAESTSPGGIVTVQIERDHAFSYIG